MEEFNCVYFGEAKLPKKMEQGKWGNYNSCCRLCLDDKIGSLRSIFEDVTRGKALVQQIRTYIGIEVKADDKLTTMICEQCLSKVHMWNTFKKSCFENQDKLKNWEANNITFSELEIKPEPEQYFDSIPIEAEDIYDEPPLLSPHPPEDIMEGDPLVEIEIDKNRNSAPILNGAGTNNSTVCSFCNKRFSSEGNRRRHEKNLHGRKSLPVNKDPLETVAASTTNNNNETDVQKIEFAAGLQLKRRSIHSNIFESAFTNVEIAYLEKMKSILQMMDTLICVCHDEKFDALKDLFLHLKKQRTWFAMFTCYNCLITYNDRGSYMRHYCSCSKDLLLNTKRLSELSQNSEIKIRVYQNFKCVKCDIIYAFYDDFCDHLDKSHMEVETDVDSSPYTCVCTRTFDDAEELKEHLNVTCFIIYYCDACFTTHDTIDTFRSHCEVEHDLMDGNSLELYDYYHKSKIGLGEASPEPINEVGRRISTRRRTLNQLVSSQAQVKSSHTLEPEQEDENYTPKPFKVINPHAFRNMKPSKPAACPVCDKVYSSYHNMLRHYTVAHDENGLILPCSYCSEKFRLISELKEHEATIHEIVESPDEKPMINLPKFSCPDCKTMFNTSEEWKKHIESHPKQACEECGKQFSLLTDLEQHRSVHLNIKVYRDSKTHNYKSTMLIPTLSCSVCAITFDTTEELMEHKLLHENMPELSIQNEKIELGERYSCTPCNTDFSSYADIHDHIIKHHPDQEPFKEFPKQCPYCDKVLQTRGAYGNHKRMHNRLMGLTPKNEDDAPRQKFQKTSDDSESYYTCKKCFKVFSSKYNLKNHMKSHGIAVNTNRSSVKTGKVLKTYWCDVCHQACVGYTELQEHKLTHRQKVSNIVSEPDLPQQNNPFIFICDICNSSFSTSFALKRHREKHEQDGLVVKQTNVAVYCKYCKIPFANAEQWNEHMANEHEEGPVDVKDVKLLVKTYSCKICKKVFDNSGALASHQGWHKRGKDGRKILNDVISIKTEMPLQKPKIKLNAHRCSSCALQFVNETALQIHILETHRNITRVLQLNCSSCRTSFDSKVAYDTHMELHKVVECQRKPAKPFACTYCPSTFSRKDRLRGHIKLHHGETVDSSKLFNCTQCNRSFDKQTALVIHLKVHERHRLSGTGSDVYKTTPKSTSDKNLYFCSICDLGFAIPKDLRTHVITAHPF